MDFARPSRRRIDALLRSSVALLLVAWSASAAAIGTDAGARIDSTAQMTFDIVGVAQPGVSSNTVTVVVDEVLDAVVIDADAGRCGHERRDRRRGSRSGDEHRQRQRAVSSRRRCRRPRRRLRSRPSRDLSRNATARPGLQLGAGGDTPYTIGANDPVLVRDTSVSVYVASNIPRRIWRKARLGRVSLRAVPRTVFIATGTDDPANPAFPTPGTAYPGAGDPAPGGGNVVAVVGSTFASGALRLRAEGAYRVDAARGDAEQDGHVGHSIRPAERGSFPARSFTTASTVGVAGSNTAQGLVVRDPLPANLAYVACEPRRLRRLPPGQQADDDFAPFGSDNTGFDGPNNTVVVTLGDVVGGGAPVVISFNATIR